MYFTQKNCSYSGQKKTIDKHRYLIDEMQKGKEFGEK